MSSKLLGIRDRTKNFYHSKCKIGHIFGLYLSHIPNTSPYISATTFPANPHTFCSMRGPLLPSLSSISDVCRCYLSLSPIALASPSGLSLSSALSPNTVAHHCHPLLSSIAVIHRCHPSLSPAAVVHCCRPPLSPVAVVCHCHPPLLPVAVVCRCCPPLSLIAFIHCCHCHLSLVPVTVTCHCRPSLLTVAVATIEAAVVTVIVATTSCCHWCHCCSRCPLQPPSLLLVLLPWLLPLP